jgi:hypothetical protein
VRSDEAAAVLLDCEEIAGPIGEVNGVTVHCWGSRNVATRSSIHTRFPAPVASCLEALIGMEGLKLARSHGSWASVIMAQTPSVNRLLRAIRSCIGVTGHG